jgi:hypothetical protein
MHNCIIVMIIIVLLLVMSVCRHSTVSSRSYWVKKHKNIHGDLIMMVDQTLETLGDGGIDAFIIGGALLGSQRNGDLIPWDDDIDLAIYHKPGENKQLISKIKNIYVECDDVTCKEMYTKNVFFGLKIYHHTLDVFLDIFLFTDYGDDKVFYTNERARLRWPNMWLMKDEVFNTTTCDIRGESYPCPSNTLNVVKRWYGDDCLEYPRITHLHLSSVIDKTIIKCFSLVGFDTIND